MCATGASGMRGISNISSRAGKHTRATSPTQLRRSPLSNWTCAPNLRSIGLLAAHIIAARVVWFHAVMGEGPADLVPMRTWDDYDPIQQNTAELVAGLEVTWSLIQQCLARWTPADLEQIFQRRDGPVSRQWIIWHVIEHDLYHGGELFL